MKKHNGSMLAYLNQETQGAASGAYRVEMIDAEKIIPNDKNFYSIEGIEEMANSLAVSEHMPPLEVVENGDGTYRLISGERRLTATICRIRRGELEKAQLPCHILPPFEAKGALTAEQVETLAIILANNYRQKTPLDKLNEIEKMEPIARSIYEDTKDKQDPEAPTLRFRTFFAKDILDISEAQLHRLQSLVKLSDSAKKAFDEDLIGSTVAMLLSPEEHETQDEYIKALREGTVQATVAGVKSWLSGAEEPEEEERQEAREASFSPEEADYSQEETEMDEPQEEASSDKEEPESGDYIGRDEEEAATPAKADTETGEDEYQEPEYEPEESYEEKWEEKGQQRLFDTIPEGLSPEEAEKDANHWVIHNLEQLFEDVQTRIDALKEAGMVSEAAKWGIRLSTLKFFIETFRE